MSSKYKTYPGGTFFVTLTVVDWIALFIRKEFAELVIKNLNYCVENKGLEIHDCVIMPNHIHMIAGSEVNLSSILRDFKSFTAKRIISAIQDYQVRESRGKWMLNQFRYNASFKRNVKNFQLWKHGSHPIAITTPRIYNQTRIYLLQNPVKAGFVSEPQHYLYSTAHPMSRIKTIWKKKDCDI